MTRFEIMAMRDAVRLAAERSQTSEVRVAPIVYALYSGGLTDLVKLAEAAGMLATSRTFN